MTLTSALTLVPEEPLGMQDSRPQSFHDQKGGGGGMDNS